MMISIYWRRKEALHAHICASDYCDSHNIYAAHSKNGLISWINAV